MHRRKTRPDTIPVRSRPNTPDNARQKQQGWNKLVSLASAADKQQREEKQQNRKKAKVDSEESVDKEVFLKTTAVGVLTHVVAGGKQVKEFCPFDASGRMNLTTSAIRWTGVELLGLVREDDDGTNPGLKRILEPQPRNGYKILACTQYDLVQYDFVGETAYISAYGA